MMNPRLLSTFCYSFGGILSLSALTAPAAQAGFFYVSDIQKEEIRNASPTPQPSPDRPCNRPSGKKSPGGAVCKLPPSALKPIPLTPRLKGRAPTDPRPVQENANPSKDLQPSSRERPVLDLPQQTLRTWRAQKGTTLRHVLEGWTHQAGVDLEWSSEFDYPLSTSFEASGSFEDALKKVLDAFHESSPRPYGRLHRSGNNAILVIQTRGKTHYGN